MSKIDAVTFRQGFTTFATANSKAHDPRGSIWRRWDLHVHTPKSFEHQYPGGDTPEGWNAYLEDLRKLPPTIKVLGINDYITIDGYEVVAAEHSRGNLPNIDLILPVIELRLDTFSGTDTSWNKVNFHVIFSNDVEIADIRAHFLSSLEAKHSLWQGKIIDRRTLAEFGKRVIESIPVGKRHGNYTPEDVAYRHLTFDLKDLQRYLRATVFKDKQVTAIGKAEWANMRWDTAIPDKRTIIDSAQIIFTAAETPEACRNAQRKLHEEGVKAPLLDCSDAHHPSASKEKDRLGHCYTWLKADSTFDGLRQVLHDPSGRIYIGDKPRKLSVVEQNPTKFIKSVRINKKADSTLDEDWFDNTIELNHDFVAIIGNRGMGKSALTDIIALTSNADASAESYAFLDKDHFRDAENKAAHFTATTIWHAGPPTARDLDQNVARGAVPLVRYIPQHHFEKLCNETAHAGRLQRELHKVIYSHLNPTETLGHATLQELINDRTSTADHEIATLRARLEELNKVIIETERATTSKAIAMIENELAIKNEEKTAHASSKPLPVPPPPEQPPSPDLDLALEERRTIAQKVEQTREALRQARSHYATATDLEQRLNQFNHTAARLKQETATFFATLGLNYDDVVVISINTNPVITQRDTLKQTINEQDAEFSRLQNALIAINERIVAITDALDEPSRQYQQYKTALAEWEDQGRAIIGTEQDTGSVTELTKRLANARDASTKEVTRLRAERAAISRSIHEQQLAKAAFQRGLYAKLQKELENHPVLAAKLPIQFDARLTDTALATMLNEAISHNVRGAFSDPETITELLRSTNINDANAFGTTLDTILTKLFDSQDIDYAEHQLKRAATIEHFYNYLFGLEYVDVRYSLRIKGRELSQLTPGERGSILLVFYLLADRDDRPLIIDQPEENLDNQSLVDLVVPCIEEAKQRRQIIMVTHNPNLAVVCDAEQIIWSHIDKDKNYKVTYETGSLENPRMNKHVVDVLEGTWPAFTTREHRYQKNE